MQNAQAQMSFRTVWGGIFHVFSKNTLFPETVMIKHFIRIRLEAQPENHMIFIVIRKIEDGFFRSLSKPGRGWFTGCASQTTGCAKLLKWIKKSVIMQLMDFPAKRPVMP